MPAATLVAIFNPDGSIASIRYENGDLILHGQLYGSSLSWKAESTGKVDTTALEASLLTAKNTIARAFSDGWGFVLLQAESPTPS